MCKHYYVDLSKEDRHFVDSPENDNCLLCLVNANPDGMTQAEIAGYLGLSKMRICQIEHQALNKIDKKIRKVLQVPPALV